MYRKAADGGDHAAQYSLGMAYELGLIGLEEDKGIALDLYRNAADGGDQAVQCELSQAYHLGRFGLDVDQEKAFEYVQKAARGGSSKAKDIVKKLWVRPLCVVPRFVCCSSALAARGGCVFDEF